MSTGASHSRGREKDVDRGFTHKIAPGVENVLSNDTSLVSL